VLAALALLIVFAGLELSRPVTILGEQPKESLIVNTPAQPVPTRVQGTVNVNGSISGVVQSQQSGAWGVSVINSPLIGIDPTRNTVKLLSSGSVTRLLMDDDYNGMPEGTTTFATPIDVSPYSKVRVSATINGSGEIRFSISSGTTVGGPNQNLRRIETFESGTSFTRVYEVPGVSLHIGMTPNNANNQALIQVYGH
jgi:hypothetical protein